MFPTLFLSHGSPLHAQVAGAAGKAWAAMAAALPRPQAVLMVSAHWETARPTVSVVATPETIHDFGGFPEALYKIRYPAPGAPAEAEQTASMLERAGFVVTRDAVRGLDHGAWVPLRNMYPQADVPVFQLSVQTALGPRHHWQLGVALSALRESCLIVASGHVTHNLREAMQVMRGVQVPGAQTSALAFGEWLHARLTSNDIEALLDYRQRSADGARAHPTEEHLLPLYVALGAAMGGVGADGVNGVNGANGANVVKGRGSATRIYQGIEWQTLVMDAYRFG